MIRPSSEITPGARFEEDLDADSLDLVEVVLRLEETFEIDIPDTLEIESVPFVGVNVSWTDQAVGDVVQHLPDLNTGLVHIGDQPIYDDPIAPFGAR